MARAGGFGSGSLNPLASGSSGGFGQYDIGEQPKPSNASNASATNATDLQNYLADTKYANGEMSDAAYLQDLGQRLASAKTPEERASLENKIHDTEYSIGSARAEAAGLDAVIAFEQSTLAGMDPGNYRALALRGSLDSHLASRRNRDYSNLLSKYDDPTHSGLSTEDILAWVEGTLAALPPTASDYDYWRRQVVQLEGNIATEKWNQLSADHADLKVSDANFLAAITARRDALNPNSPDWDEWNRSLTQEMNNQRNEKLGREDKAASDKWQAGKMSDASYLLYVERRVAALPAGDPDLAVWTANRDTLKFNMAGNVLVYNVNIAKTDSARKDAQQDLLAFDKAYLATLNPGSQLYRDTKLRIATLEDQMKVSSGGGGGGSGGGGGGGGASGGLAAGQAAILPPAKTTIAQQIANLKRTMAAFANPKVKAQDRNIAESILDGNITAATRALALPDEYGQGGGGAKTKFFLFHDPANPTAVTGAIDEATGKPLLDAAGKRIMVRGSRYYAATPETLAGLLNEKSAYNSTYAEVQRLTGKGNWEATAHIAEAASRKAFAISATDQSTQAMKIATTRLLGTGMGSISYAQRQADITGDAASAVQQTLDATTYADYFLEGPGAAWTDEKTTSALETARRGLAGSSILAKNLIDTANTTIAWKDLAGVEHTTTPDAIGEDEVLAAAVADAFSRGAAGVSHVAMAPGVFHTVNVSMNDPRMPDGSPNWGWTKIAEAEYVALADQLPPGATDAAIIEEWQRQNGYIKVVTTYHGLPVPSTAISQPVTKSSLARPSVSGWTSAAGKTDQPGTGVGLAPTMRIKAYMSTTAGNAPSPIGDRGGAAYSLDIPADVLLGNKLQYLTYADENGSYTLFSVDNWQTAARSGHGMTPVLEWKVPLRVIVDPTSVGTDTPRYLYFTPDGQTQLFSAEYRMGGNSLDGQGRVVPGAATTTLVPKFDASMDLSPYIGWAGAGDAPVTMVWDSQRKTYVRGWDAATWKPEIGAQATTQILTAGSDGSFNTSSTNTGFAIANMGANSMGFDKETFARVGPMRAGQSSPYATPQQGFVFSGGPMAPQHGPNRSHGVPSPALIDERFATGQRPTLVHLGPPAPPVSSLQAQAMAEDANRRQDALNRAGPAQPLYVPLVTPRTYPVLPGVAAVAPTTTVVRTVVRTVAPTVPVTVSRTVPITTPSSIERAAVAKVRAAKIAATPAGQKAGSTAPKPVYTGPLGR